MFDNQILKSRTNLSDINDFTLCQILGVKCSSLIKRDEIYKDIEKVYEFKSTDLVLDILPSINCKSIYNKDLLKFINAFIQHYNLDLNINKIKKWSIEDFNKIKSLTHKDYWYYKINLYKQGLIIIKERKQKELKQQEWGYSDVSINNYLNNIPYNVTNKVLNIFDQTTFHEINKYIYSCESIYDILELKNEIFTEGTFLNKIFNIEETKGSGKGEMLIAFLFKGKCLGPSSKFDILLDNGCRIEVKATNLSFRFGTKASIGNYNFYTNIISARNIIRELIKQLGQKFKQIVSQEFYDLSTCIIQEGDFTKENAISSAIDSAEVSEKRFNLICLWFFLAYVETHKFNYAYTIKQDVFTKQYEVFDNDYHKLINVLKSLEYVNNPLKLNEDINLELHKCFEGIDYLVIFKEKDNDISICTTADEIMMSCISQNGIKVIEKDKDKKDYLKETFKLWSKNKECNFYECYNNLKHNT